MSFRTERSAVRNLLFLSVLSLGGLFVARAVSSDSISERGKRLHFSTIVVDTHDYTTQLLLHPKFDLGVRHSFGSIDIPRMRASVLAAIFFSICSPTNITVPTAVQQTLDNTHS